MRRTIHNLKFLGVPHRPDLEVVVPGTTIAVEIKRGATGQTVREGIGQALVYTRRYDFAVVAIFDTSRKKKIVNALGGEAEKEFVDMLWKRHNIRFVVV